MKSSFKNLSLPILVLLSFVINAQVKIGSNATIINDNSVLELESTNKGLLLPRMALTSTANVAPLTAHVEGMTIYNTATTDDVTPGYYYNDGAKWVRIADAASIGSNNWFNVATNTAATANTQNIYQIGNVGIGTTSPQQRLHIVGNTLSTRFISIDTISAVSNGSRNYAAITPGIKQGERSGYSFFGTFKGTTDNGPRRVADIIGGYSNLAWGDEYLSFNVGGSDDAQKITQEKMRIQANGNLGIGVVNPIAQLHTTGSVLFAGAGIPGVGKVLTSDASGLATWQSLDLATTPSASEPWYNVASGTGATSNTQNIYQMGRVGIGTSTSPSNLSVRQDTDNFFTTIEIRNNSTKDSTSGGQLLFGGFRDVTTNTNGIASIRGITMPGDIPLVKSGALAFYTQNANNGTTYGELSERMRITPSGNVGIGTNSPNVKLDVNGYIKVGSTDVSADFAPTAGLIRFNTITSKFQGYDGSIWVDLN